MGTPYTYNRVTGAGGGATDIRTVGGLWDFGNSLNSRIMVAGGGGGGGTYGLTWDTSYICNGGAGGGISGIDGGKCEPSAGKAGTQTSGNARGTGASNSGIDGGIGGGGGGGYYGGGNGGIGTAVYSSGGGGGSSFISGHIGCNAIDSSGNHTGQPNHYSAQNFTDTKMVAGNASMPNPRAPGNITGNAGNGFARITYLG